MITALQSLRRKVRGTLLRLEDRKLSSLLKLAEIRLLKKHASTYCYNFPSHVLIELTAKCNLRCVWCQQSDAEWRKRNWSQMDLDDVQRVLPSLEGARVLLLYNIGEPLVYKGIFEAIREARKYIPQVRITTNGVLLTREKSRQLEDAGLTQLNVSIDSPDPEIFQRIRGTDLGKIVDNLHTFCDETDIPLHFWTVISTANVESLKMLPEFAAQFSNCRQLYFQLVQGFDLTAKAGIDIALSEETFEDFREVILEKCERYGLRTNLEYIGYYLPGFFEKKADAICTFLTTSLISINTKGYLNPCCAYRELELDNVLEEGGFRKAWNGPQVRAWRRKMLNQEYGNFCQNWCGFDNKGGTEDLDDLEFQQAGEESPAAEPPGLEKSAAS